MCRVECTVGAGDQNLRKVSRFGCTEKSDQGKVEKISRFTRWRQEADLKNHT